MLKLDPAHLAPDPETTVWVGDPAVDIEQSDVPTWCETGDMNALAFRQGERASAVKFRGLTEVELSVLESVVGNGETRFVAAASMGLVSVDGMKLRFDVLPVIGVRHLCRDHTAQLQGMKARFAPGPALNRWSRAELGRDIMEGEGLERVEEMGLMAWLGAQVLARSFRRRG